MAAEPFQHAIDGAGALLAQGNNERQSLEEHLRTARRRDRRSIRAELAIADHDAELATAHRTDATRRARLTAAETANASRDLNDLRQQQWRERLFARWAGGTEAIDILQLRLNSLDTWQGWAAGNNLDPNCIREMAAGLLVINDETKRFATLRRTLVTHLDTPSVDLSPHSCGVAQHPPEMTIEMH